MEPRDYIVRMNELNEKKLALMEELLLFTRSQKEVIEAGRLEELDLLIKEKQLRMDAVDKLDEEFVVYSSRLKSVLSISSLESLPDYHIPGTDRLKELVASIHQRLAEIKALDDENRALIEAEMKNTRDKIDHAKTFKRATGAYYPQQHDTPSYFFDKKN